MTVMAGGGIRPVVCGRADIEKKPGSIQRNRPPLAPLLNERLGQCFSFHPHRRKRAFGFRHFGLDRTVARF
jgi:hypothetical protein